MRAIVPASLAVLTSGCFFYPATVQYYDPGCEIQARRMELQSKVMADMCNGAQGHEAAVGCLTVLAGMTAGSAVVSGSIVLVGNSVYWFEKRGRCVAKSAFA